MNYFASNIFSVSCAISAGVLAYRGIDGWGWFLLAGVACYTTLRPSESKGDSDE